ncbi:MAG TPA: TolC family protein [Candidatus Margulisiibacteriota bacterium]|nr:TolC family protein [Candidatus Margulisiibacteriota bacterium]
MRTTLGAWALGFSGVVLTTVVLAQEPIPISAPAEAPPPRDVHLLDDVPNYAQILQDQWRAGVPADVSRAEDSSEYYGRLVDVGKTQGLSLNDCIALALKNNTNLQIQRLNPVAATAGVRRAWSQFDPRAVGYVNRFRNVSPATTALTAGPTSLEQLTTFFTSELDANAGLRKTLLSGGALSFDFNNRRIVTNPSIATPITPEYITTLGLSLNQPLLRDFGWRYALLVVEIAQNTEQVAYHQYEASISNTIAQVEAAYWNFVLAIEAVQVQEQSLALAQELQRQNEGKFNVGALPQTAVLEAKSQVASREATLIQARNLAVIARDNLRALINSPAPDKNSLALIMIEPTDRPGVPDYPIDLERSLRTALEQRPELTAARLNVHGAGLQRKVAENQLLPRLNFAGGVGVNGLSGTDNSKLVSSTTLPVLVSQDLSGSYTRSIELMPDGRFYNWSAGATLEIPIDNAQAKADYAKANIDFEQSSLSLRDLQERVTLEIKTAVSNLQSDLKSIDATRIARELAEENLRNQKARYDVGLATTKDLLDYQDQLTQARFREINALTRYNTDLAEMRRVEGSLLSARNVLIERVTPEKAPWWATF